MREELASVTQDIDAMKDLMIHIVYDMLDLEVSNYPVFVMSLHELDVIRQPGHHAGHKTKRHVHHVHAFAGILHPTHAPVHKLVRLGIIRGWPHGN